MKVCAAPLAALLALAGCSQPVPERGNEAAPPRTLERSGGTTLENSLVPVRIGERGPAFAACAGRGATRDPPGAEPVPVRLAPFEQAGQIDRLDPGSEFFICQRSHDQRWSGVVFDAGGEASARCNVSAPVAQPRNYLGPCAAGWVPSARVRLVSGEPHQVPENAAMPAE